MCFLLLTFAGFQLHFYGFKNDSQQQNLRKKSSAQSHESCHFQPQTLTENTSGYLTGWFTPDIALLSLDVMTFFGTSSTDVQSLTLLRLFRSLRLLRLVRMMGRAHLLKEHLTGSEFMGALASATWEQCSVWFSLGQFKREKHHHPLYF